MYLEIVQSLGHKKTFKDFENVYNYIHIFITINNRVFYSRVSSTKLSVTSLSRNFTGSERIFCNWIICKLIYPSYNWVDVTVSNSKMLNVYDVVDNDDIILDECDISKNIMFFHLQFN